MSQGGARGQNLGHLIFGYFFFYFYFFAFIFLFCNDCNHSNLKNRYYSGLTTSL